MRKIDFMLILASLFILRIIVFSAGYADAMCLTSVLIFRLTKEYLKIKKIQSEVLIRVEAQDTRLQHIADEVTRVKNSSEGLKAAINLTSKR